MQNTWVIPSNTGRAFEVRGGQTLAIRGTTIADFVAFNLQDTRERFDQARTKVNNQKIFITAGDWLYTFRNDRLLQIVTDDFAEGHHDLQYGMCSRSRYRIVLQMDLNQYFGRPTRPEDVPDHGCWENLSQALEPYGIGPLDIPNPFNVFQDVSIDGRTGQMRMSKVRPRPGSSLVLRAAIDCLCAVSACPDPHVGGRDLEVTVQD